MWKYFFWLIFTHLENIYFLRSLQKSFEFHWISWNLFKISTVIKITKIFSNKITNKKWQITQIITTWICNRNYIFCWPKFPKYASYLTRQLIQFQRARARNPNRILRSVMFRFEFQAFLGISWTLIRNNMKIFQKFHRIDTIFDV